MNPCECEHDSHGAAGDTNATAHPYGIGEPHRLIKTPYGTFALCRECVSSGHMGAK